MNPGFIQNVGAASEQPVFEFKTYQAMSASPGNNATVVRGTVLVQDVLGASANASTYTNDGGRLDTTQHYIQANSGANGNALSTNRAVKVGVVLDEVATSNAISLTRLALEGDVEARVVARNNTAGGPGAVAVDRGTPLTAVYNANGQGDNSNAGIGCFKVAVTGEPIHAYAVGKSAGSAAPLTNPLLAAGSIGLVRVRLVGYTVPMA